MVESNTEIKPCAILPNGNCKCRKTCLNTKVWTLFYTNRPFPQLSGHGQIQTFF
jgi:hypothetical protein